MEKAETFCSKFCQAAAATCKYFEGVESFCWTRWSSHFRAGRDLEGSAGLPRRDDAEAAALLPEAALQAGGKGRAKIGASQPCTLFIL